MKRWLLAVAGLALGGAVLAGIEADPNKDYAVTPEAGPWMVCATSYVGPEAGRLAHELVLEIRSRFNLPAYAFNRGDDERRKQREEFERLQEKHPGAKLPFRHTRVEDQCAVLIGGYKDMETASQALKMIKRLQPPSNERLMPILTEVGPDESSKEKDKAIVRGGFVNPFPSSFVVPNPTVPRERPATGNADKFLVKLNAHESFSLLKCKKSYTLLVAAYQGMHAFQAEKAEKPSFLESLWSHSTGDVLEASGHNAHNLAEGLRKVGFEAYVLHAREGSLVCIGGFDRADDPEMMKVQRLLGSNIQLSQSGNMLAQPVAMPIPRP